eukprot:TRINITY_DN10696_c0_g1_i1.p1 TRINITY_DN10696_c0_g1~~TRINITY_DN10696_c0_g1_i1.p1  ORF type:complete len:1037 (+),score=82.84 TRINITY_DN10696_c0_g1_i1:67-3177(+)
MRRALCLGGAVIIPYKDLKGRSEHCLAHVHKAFVGDKSLGAILISDVPGLAEAKKEMFEKTANLMFADVERRRQDAQVRRLWPGFKSAVDYADPLQGGFLHNPVEITGPCEVDPFAGKNRFPDDDLQTKSAALDLHVRDITLSVMRCCDEILKKELGDAVKERPSMESLIERSPFAFANFKVYESDFSREDDTESKRYEPADVETTYSEDGVASHGKDSSEKADLSSMRTASTAIRTTKTSKDGQADLSSMRTASTAIRTTKTSKDGQADLSSMRTASTAIRTTKASNDGQADLSSMRTASTAIRTTKASKDGQADLSSMRTASTAIRTTKASKDGEADLSSMRTASTAIRTTKSQNDGVEKAVEDGSDTEMAPFWLPWHIDHNFISTLTGESYFDEKTGQLAYGAGAVSDPDTGLVGMNAEGDIVGIAPHLADDTMIALIGSAAQVYSGGVFRASRHAVKRVAAEPGLARCVFNTFWYGPWDHVYTTPPGKNVDECINSGWNGMMDRSGVDSSARRIYSNFRRHFQDKIGNETGPDAELFEEMCKVLPDTLADFQHKVPTATIDFISDLSCPIAYITFKRLEQALAACSAESKVQLRFQPMLLNPDQVREPMSSYMLRSNGKTMDQVRSADAPQNRAANELGFNFNHDRPVINTILSHSAVDMAERQGGVEAAHKVYKKLAQCYFEEGKDISEVAVMKAVFEELGLTMDSVLETGSGARVMSMHHKLQQHVQSVPYIVVRNSGSGEGLMIDGPASADYLREELMRVLQPKVVKESGANDLLLPPTIAIQGFSGRPAFPLADRTAEAWSSTVSIGDWSGPAAWPYKPEDFSRLDESDDSIMYQQARIGVQHIDHSASQALETTYRRIFSTAPCANFAALDLCSSWTSHYPRDIVHEALIDVHGINMEELLANDLASTRTVGNLNIDPKLNYKDEQFHFVTMALSVDYLTQPREVFQEIHRVLKPGGVAVISFSNRCFETKAVKLWLDSVDEGLSLVNVVKDYFRFGPSKGWSHINSLDVTQEDGEDPMWVVTAVKQ